MEEMSKQDVVAGPVAHVREDGCCESVSTHLREVADMAERFADETGLVGLGTYARAAGALALTPAPARAEDVITTQEYFSYYHLGTPLPVYPFARPVSRW